MQVVKAKESDPLRAWLAKYTPVEREIFAAREKRLANAKRRRAEKTRRFGDLCEATEGLAVAWRRKGTPLAEQIDWAGDDVFTLACLARYNRLQGIPLSCLAHHRRQCAGRVLDRLRHRLKRPLYYAAENARRHALAAERRRITRRSTVNPCPTREVLLDAWTRRRASPADAIRFGSLLEDLECYLDNSLRRDEGGNIVGRNGGIKRWLQTEIPALYLCYTTVMRYKAAARKLRQIAEVRDPVPAAWVVSDSPAVGVKESESQNRMAGRKAAGFNPTAAHGNFAAPKAGDAGDVPAAHAMGPYAIDMSLLQRARAIWREVTVDVAPHPTALMDRLDAFLDPERIEEAYLLAAWRAKYANEITVRTKYCDPPERGRSSKSTV